MTSFPHIFKPLTLRHKTLDNRVVFGAHTNNMAQGGVPGDQQIGYYRERARGGAGMIVVEPMPVHPAAILTRGNFLHSSDEVIPHFRRLTDACHDHGTVMIQQLYHIGAHGDQDNAFHPAWSPSGGPSWHDSDGSHAMSGAEIEETIAGFVAAAVRCQKAGFDGVEVWAAYHGLVDQFWTPFSNTRDDHWGGSLENRTRFSREILSRIRQACGDDFIIGLAISDEPDVPAALSRESTSEIVALHDRQELMDYVTCGVGSYFDFYKLMPTFLYGEKLGTDLSRQIKGVVNHALVTAEAHIRTPENANTVLGAGDADLVSIVRGQIADPHLVNKARAGRDEDVRGCLSCNQMCWGRRSRDYWISCLINPSAGREHEWGGEPFDAAPVSKSVLVVGGGPAGLEAARVAAERGHKVILAEAAPDLGGQFRLAGQQPRRGQVMDLLHWYERQLAQLGVDVRLNTYLDEDGISEIAAGEVIIATGALPAETGFQRALAHVPELPGLELGQVWSADDVLNRVAKLGHDVIVLDEGGNWRGCGTALKLAEEGHAVTLITPDAVVGKELARTAADFPLRQRLAALGVRFMTEHAIIAWGGSGAEALNLLTGETSSVAASALVLATTPTANDVLRDAGQHLIGDGAAPRNAACAFYDGRKVARTI